MSDKEPIISDLVSQEIYDRLDAAQNLLAELLILEQKLNEYGYKITIDDSKFKVNI